MPGQAPQLGVSVRAVSACDEAHEGEGVSGCVRSPLGLGLGLGLGLRLGSGLGLGLGSLTFVPAADAKALAEIGGVQPALSLVAQ